MKYLSQTSSFGNTPSGEQPSGGAGVEPDGGGVIVVVLFNGGDCP